VTAPAGVSVEPPLAVLAELTHRCPLRCPYCSNPIKLSRASAGSTRPPGGGCSPRQRWAQVHFSGGEPLVRRDLVELVGHAKRPGSTST
jgi:pyrroloquinoline quinone biosynthesis protein E